MNTYDMILFTDDLAANRAALADGVTGITCTYVGPVFDSPMGDVERQLAKWAKHSGFLSSVESYANGAHNAYVRSPETQKVVGFVKVRPAA